MIRASVRSAPATANSTLDQTQGQSVLLKQRADLRNQKWPQGQTEQPLPSAMHLIYPQYKSTSLSMIHPIQHIYSSAFSSMFANSQPIKSEQTVWLAPNLELRHVEKLRAIFLEF
jgi:hypothetical protein